jgi:hypothetical protein
MTYCYNCGKELPEQSANFCPHCGANQTHFSPAAKPPSKGNPTVVTVLCILTIIGSSFGIIRGFLYEAVADVAGNDHYLYGYAFSFLNLGTLIAAVLMLAQKSAGFYSYIVFQIIYIALVIFRATDYLEPYDSYDRATNSFALFISAIFVIPSFVFLILYISLAAKYFLKKTT